MNGFVVQPAPQVTLPVDGSSAVFPVRRVYCVGRNYAEHAREMGFLDREPPFFFAKPTDALVPVAAGASGRLNYPSRTDDYQHEVELVAAIGRGGGEIPVERAFDHVWGYGVGLDMTRRDRQIDMRKQSRPWEIGKSFDHSAVVGPLRPASAIGHPRSGRIWLAVDGDMRQQADVGHLIWNVAEIVAHLSTWFELRPGDIVFTGTPAGVGGVRPGQVMHAGVDGVGELCIGVEEERRAS